jgi:hypothetical protein
VGQAFGLMWITAGGQGFGGYLLAGKFTDYVVMGILKTVGVDTWERLKGTPIRVKGDNSGIEAIGHYLEERWFNPADFKEEAK